MVLLTIPAVMHKSMIFGWPIKLSATGCSVAFPISPSDIGLKFYLCTALSDALCARKLFVKTFACSFMYLFEVNFLGQSITGSNLPQCGVSCISLVHFHSKMICQSIHKSALKAGTKPHASSFHNKFEILGHRNYMCT